MTRNWAIYVVFLRKTTFLYKMELASRGFSATTELPVKHAIATVSTPDRYCGRVVGGSAHKFLPAGHLIETSGTGEVCGPDIYGRPPQETVDRSTALYV